MIDGSPSDDRRPIAAFDSGVGGLSIVRALRVQLPSESLLYVADSTHCPYGLRSPGEIRRLSEGIVRFLIGQGAKLIVVACNTASAAALTALRASFPDTPVVGMVPPIKPAAQLTRSGVIGVLATEGTLNGHLYGEVVEHHAARVRVISQSCPGLVERIEAGDLDSPGMEALLRDCLRPLLAEGIDTLVLGCTHYPFISTTLRRILGSTICLVEPSEAVARQAARVLRREGLLASVDAVPWRAYATSGDPAALASAVERLLGERITARKLHWHRDTLDL